MHTPTIHHNLLPLTELQHGGSKWAVAFCGVLLDHFSPHFFHIGATIMASAVGMNPVAVQVVGCLQSWASCTYVHLQMVSCPTRRWRVPKVTVFVDGSLLPLQVPPHSIIFGGC